MGNSFSAFQFPPHQHVLPSPKKNPYLQFSRMVKTKKSGKFSKKVKASMQINRMRKSPLGLFMNEMQEAVSSGCPQKLQRAIDKRCDKLEKMMSNERMAASKMFQWKRNRMLDDIRILLDAMLKTKHGHTL